MFTGEEWVSDFRQSQTPRNQRDDVNGFFPNSSYQNDENEYKIYRNPKWSE